MLLFEIIKNRKMKFSQIFLVLLLSTNFLLAQFIKDVRDSIIIDLSYSSTIFADV